MNKLKEKIKEKLLKLAANEADPRMSRKQFEEAMGKSKPKVVKPKIAKPKVYKADELDKWIESHQKRVKRVKGILDYEKSRTAFGRIKSVLKSPKKLAALAGITGLAGLTGYGTLKFLSERGKNRVKRAQLSRQK